VTSRWPILPFVALTACDKLPGKICAAGDGPLAAARALVYDPASEVTIGNAVASVRAQSNVVLQPFSLTTLATADDGGF
jgi:hypothetical protein